jgi:hypothetical protein
LIILRGEVFLPQDFGRLTLGEDELKKIFRRADPYLFQDRLNQNPFPSSWLKRSKGGANKEVNDMYAIIGLFAIMALAWSAAVWATFKEEREPQTKAPSRGRNAA